MTRRLKPDDNTDIVLKIGSDYSGLDGPAYASLSVIGGPRPYINIRNRAGRIIGHFSGNTLLRQLGSTLVKYTKADAR